MEISTEISPTKSDKDEEVTDEAIFSENVGHSTNCPICQEIPKDPHFSSKCRHVACKVKKKSKFCEFSFF
jgi:hypothetical protein